MGQRISASITINSNQVGPFPPLRREWAPKYFKISRTDWIPLYLTTANIAICPKEFLEGSDLTNTKLSYSCLTFSFDSHICYARQV